ncbi:hypothetical protein BGX29_009611 [Mortierella sp. GBA35]|nr:hypothetical protein BGX29_009611 [Mortierella sp. GBA35]
MLEAAKTRIEQDLGQDSGAAMILGGFLSPSHDKYVATKLAESKILLDSQERLELCRLQTADSDWIDVDAWESSQGGFTAFHNVTSRLQRFLQDKCQTSLQNKMNALHQQLQQQQGQEWSFAAAGSGEQQMEEPKSYASSMVPQRPGSLSASHQLQQQQSAGKRNPFNIRVVYLCGADFVMRTGARKLLNGVVVVDRPLGPPSSNRRSIILTRNGESISIPVSDLSGDDSSSSSSSSNDNSSDDDNDSTSTTKLTRKERVFKRLKEGYGSEWFEASRNNIWWLPSRSQTDPEDISSTKIRERLLNRESCKGLLHPAVAQRLLENKARQDAGQDVCQDAAL